MSQEEFIEDVLCTMGVCLLVFVFFLGCWLLF